MIKMILAGVLLTVMIGCVILALREADNKSRIKYLKYLGFGALCASAAFVILCLFVILF